MQNDYPILLKALPETLKCDDINSYDMKNNLAKKKR